MTGLSATFLLLSTGEAPLLEHSLPAALAAEPDELVVVDNGCTDDTAAIAARHGVRRLAIAPRLSYAAAMNASLAVTGGDLVGLLTADCFVDPGFREAASAPFADAAVGSVAPRLLRTRGPRIADRLDLIDAAGMVVDRRRKNGLVGHGAATSAFTRPGRAFGADGAAAVYRRATLEDCAIGHEVFDEDFELWASDADLAWRARLLGWRCIYEPAAISHHIRSYSPSTRTQMSEAARQLQFRNRLLMIAKNDSAGELLRDLPIVAGYEALALGHVLLRERHLLRGYREAWRRRAGARRRRRVIQRRRRVRRTGFGLRPPA
ncbi:MAG: glycosyltransferase [Actinomycetota bacterium]|nr:glycosyltransferase [Actinomycetota bacterium]